MLRERPSGRGGLLPPGAGWAAALLGLALIVFAVAPRPALARGPGAPAGDAFPGPLVTEPDDLTLTNLGATTEAGEPLPPNGGATLWLSFVATHRAAAVTIAESDFPVFVAAYEGEALASLHEVAIGNRNAVGLFAIVFATTPGKTYHLQVGSEGVPPTPGTVRLRLLCEGEPPRNDAFPGTAITALPFEDRTSTNFATLSPGEPAIFGATVWYAYTAPAAARLLADTLGSNFPTRVAVYDQATRTLPGGRQVVSRGRCDGVDSVVVDVAAGETVWFQVGGEGFPGERGLLRFTLARLPATQVVNPRCALAAASDLHVSLEVEVLAPDGSFRPPDQRQAQAVVTWGYDAAFTGSFALSRQWRALGDVVPPVVAVAVLPATADGRQRFTEVVRFAPGSQLCYEVRPLQGELSGPVARACSERAPSDGPGAPGPPDAGSGLAARTAGNDVVLALGTVLVTLAVVFAWSGWSVSTRKSGDAQTAEAVRTP